MHFDHFAVPSSIFALLFIWSILWCLYDIKSVRYWRLKNENNAIIKINKQCFRRKFWSSSSLFVIHDLRRVCLCFVGITINSQLLDNKYNDESNLYHLLFNHFNLNNKYYHLKIMNLSLLYRATSKSINPQSFRSACSGYKNVLILIKNNFGNVIGGFTSIKIKPFNYPIFRSLDWNQYEDPDAFLICIRSYNKTLSPQIFKLKKNYTSLKNGVIFPYHQLCSFGLTEFQLYVNKNGICEGSSNSITRSGTVFDIDPSKFSGVPHQTSGCYFFSVQSIEAFHINL